MLVAGVVQGHCLTNILKASDFDVCLSYGWKLLSGISQNPFYSIKIHVEGSVMMTLTSTI